MSVRSNTFAMSATPNSRKMDMSLNYTDSFARDSKGMASLIHSANKPSAHLMQSAGKAPADMNNSWFSPGGNEAASIFDQSVKVAPQLDDDDFEYSNDALYVVGRLTEIKQELNR